MERHSTDGLKISFSELTQIQMQATYPIAVMGGADTKLDKVTSNEQQCLFNQHGGAEEAGQATRSDLCLKFLSITLAILCTVSSCDISIYDISFNSAFFSIHRKRNLHKLSGIPAC